MSSKPVDLKLDWCSHKAAEVACKRWHYSKSMPAGKLIKIGVWENGKYIGCVLYSRGANNHIGDPYELKQTEVCELTRVALNEHITPVTKIIAISLRMLKKYSPGLKLVVSYADADQGHEGAIYKAGNWFYEGLKNVGPGGATIVHGVKTHNKTLHSKYGRNSLKWIKENVDPNAELWVNKGKHKFLMPLDNDFRARLSAKLNGMRRRTSSKSVSFHDTEGGAIPTSTHQLNHEPAPTPQA